MDTREVRSLQTFGVNNPQAGTVGASALTMGVCMCGWGALWGQVQQVQQVQQLHQHWGWILRLRWVGGCGGSTPAGRVVEAVGVDVPATPSHRTTIIVTIITSHHNDLYHHHITHSHL